MWARYEAIGIARGVATVPARAQCPVGTVQAGFAATAAAPRRDFYAGPPPLRELFQADTNQGGPRWPAPLLLLSLGFDARYRPAQMLYVSVVAGASGISSARMA